MKKEDYVKKLHEDKAFQNVLGMARSDSDRRAIKAFTEEFVMSSAAGLEAITAAYEADPDGFKKKLLGDDADEVITEATQAPSKDQ